MEILDTDPLLTMTYYETFSVIFVLRFGYLRIHIVRTPTRNQVRQNLFPKNEFWVGRDGGPQPGGSIWLGHKFVGGAFS